MNIELYAVKDDSFNTSEYIHLQVKNEEEIMDIIRTKFTKKQIKKFAFFYDNLDSGHHCIPVLLPEQNL